MFNTINKLLLVAAGLGFLAVDSLSAAPALAEPTTSSGRQYARDCRARGVPLPPTWGSSSWKFSGILTDAQEFILSQRTAHVYYYESALGLCIALPRAEGDRVPAASFGVICLGTSGSSCFWDNAQPVEWDRDNGDTVYSERARITSTFVDDPGPWIGGADLATHPGGTCSDCHAGENPFVIHPGTALDLGDKLDVSRFWQSPLVPVSWPDNPGPGTTLYDTPIGPDDGSCLDCHNGDIAGRFPSISSELNGYCGVLRISNQLGVMPPFPTDQSYDKHWNALLDACQQAPTPTAGSSRDPVTPNTPTSVRIFRYRKWERLWGDATTTDVKATADGYCRLFKANGATSYDTNACGEDETRFYYFDSRAEAFMSRRSGNAEACYPLISRVACDGLTGWGDRNDVHVLDTYGRRKKLWGERFERDTADQYCRLNGFERASSWRKDTCGSDETTYYYYDRTRRIWSRIRSGNADRCYSLISNVTCTNAL